MQKSLNWVKKRQNVLINLTREVCSKAGIKLIAVKSTALNAEKNQSLNPKSDKVDFAIKYEDRKLFKEFFSKFTGTEFLYEDPYSYYKASFLGARIYFKERGVVAKAFKKGTYPNKYVSINVHWIMPVNTKKYWDTFKDHEKIYNQRIKFQNSVSRMSTENMNVFIRIITAPFRALIFSFNLMFDLLFSRVISDPKHNAFKYSKMVERLGVDFDKYVLSGEPAIIYETNYFDEISRVNIDGNQYWISNHNEEKMKEIYGVYDYDILHVSRYDYE